MIFRQKNNPCFFATAFIGTLFCLGPAPLAEFARGGTLDFILVDESDESPVIARVELQRAAANPGKSSRQMPIRKTVSAGIGVVVDRSVILDLPEDAYRFRIVRGPEYRVISGTFQLEKTSLDQKTIPLPRMVNMLEEGWVSGDCLTPAATTSLPLRMAAEDLHVAAVLGDRSAKPIPGRSVDDPIDHSPIWIRSDVKHFDGLAYYGLDQSVAKGAYDHSTERLVAIRRQHTEASSGEADALKVAIENPFAWELPVWLASGQVDGLFVLGDWVRMDRSVLSVRDGRSIDSFSLREPTQVGRYAERIYRHALNVGLPVVPLAGGGDQTGDTYVGYNRMYVTSGQTTPSFNQPLIAPQSQSQWWDGLWTGKSIATNGPMLRAMVGETIPGTTLTGTTGEVLRIPIEVYLSVRDPVDYLEVIFNDQVHYGARLDEFAEQGGQIPPIMATESGWVIVRVMTLYEGHYRAAVTAPWWIEFDGKRQVSAESVEFFQTWLSEYEQRLLRLPPDQLQSHVPYIKAARRFWQQRELIAGQTD